MEIKAENAFKQVCATGLMEAGGKWIPLGEGLRLFFFQNGTLDGFLIFLT